MCIPFFLHSATTIIVYKGGCISINTRVQDDTSTYSSTTKWCGHGTPVCKYCTLILAIPTPPSCVPVYMALCMRRGGGGASLLNIGDQALPNTYSGTDKWSRHGSDVSRSCPSILVIPIPLSLSYAPFYMAQCMGKGRGGV